VSSPYLETFPVGLGTVQPSIVVKCDNV